MTGAVFSALGWAGSKQGWLCLVLPVWAVLLAFAHTGSGRTAQPLDTDAIDRFVTKQMSAQRVPGLALAITRGDQILYVQGYGRAGDDQPVTAQTQFLVASLSKSFTALAVMQLVEAGRIDLDAPLQRYLPDFTLADPAAASQITIRHLLNQTGGLADAGFPAMRLPQPATPEERLDSLRRARPVAQPGTEFHYYDVNYQILAHVVQVVSGRPFTDYVQASILTPLHMEHSLSALTSSEALERADSLAQGHLLLFGLPVAAAEESGYIAGSGGMVTTAADMAHYLVMQSSGGRFEGAELISPAGVTLMHTPPPGLDSSYAMGWVETTHNGTRILEHSGIFSTFYAEMALLPESGYGLALLYNIQSLAQASLGFAQIKQGLEAMLAGTPLPGGGVSVGAFEFIATVVPCAGVAIAVRSLLRLPRWGARARTVSLWRLVPGILWRFVPGALVAAMPTIVLSTSGRAFGYRTLWRSMPEVMTWLGLTGVLEAIAGAARIILLARRRGNRDAPGSGS